MSESNSARAPEPTRADDEPTPEMPGTPPSPPGRVRGLLKRLKWPMLAGALAGMVFGAVIEMFVQGMLESTGWFGPTIESLIQNQTANFDAVQAKLAELKTASTDAERKRLEKELTVLLEEQRQLAGETHSELQQSQQQIEELRRQVLKQEGHESAVDFYLRPGQSVNFGQRGNAFALNSVHASFVQATINGKSIQLKPGEFAEAEMPDGTYRVVFRMGPTRTDKTRAGFDLIRPSD